MHYTSYLPMVVALGALATVTMPPAQPVADPAALAQQSYERELSACNNGTLPAPQREACVREAGARLDRARGTPPSDTVVTTPDGRATVVMPDTATPPSGSADVSTTRDGRANMVPSR